MKKKSFKKILSLLLSLVLMVSVGAVGNTPAYAATRTGTTGDLSWSLDTSTGVLTISGTGYSENYANSASKRAPWYTLYRTTITSVVVEDGVTGLGDYLFYNCTKLTSVTIPDSVDTIGSDCFRSCSALTNITLPSGCTWYYKELFLDCTSLVWVIMPQSNSTNDYAGMIPDGTFSGCTSLEEVYIGDGHTSLDTKAFYNCTSLNGVIWDSGEISSIGTNALYNVPSTCSFIDEDDSLASWASTNGYNCLNLTDTCSDNTYSSSNLTYSFDFVNATISFSGSGEMTSTPWQAFHYFIHDITFADVDNTYTISDSAFANCIYLDTVVFNTSTEGELHIYPYAFSGCTATTYWLNLPANTKYVDEYAFYGTNFNYVTIASESLTIGDEAFGDSSGSYARFFGLHDSGAYDYVLAGREKGYSWYYYCLNDAHTYVTETVSPTCTEQGYDLYYCPYCDVDSSKSNYTDASGHNYVYSSTEDASLVYTCARCGATDLKLDAVAVKNLFADAISHDNDNSPYNQSNYESSCDVYNDGYVNVRDFRAITEAISNIDTTNKQTVLDESTTYQTIEGFGASACWWSQVAGDWDNIDDIMSLLYSEEDGIGLNIYRYNLGAGSDGDTNVYYSDRTAECFLQSDGTYDWSADSAAMNALASAQKANSNLKVTLFSNSAPVYLTDNGFAYCTPDSETNLSEENYQAFADFIVTCAEHFIEEGYDVTCVSPINEPEWSWAASENSDGSYSVSQEGCHWTSEEACNFYNNYMIPALQESEILNEVVDISIWESGQLNNSTYWDDFLETLFSSSSSILTGGNYASSNSNIRSYCDTVDTHSYWASQSDRETVADQLDGTYFSSITKVRCTEYCQMTNDGNNGVYDLIQEEGGSTNGMTIEYGIALADIMYQDLTILDAVEWDWWTACSQGIYPDALVYIDYDNTEDVQTSKRLWCMGNYSKFIDEGAQRISVSTESGITSDIKESAYLNPDGSVAIVYINSGDTTQYTTFDSSTYSSFTTYVTDETHDLSEYQSGTVGDEGVAIPAQSVTTVVLTK